MDKKELFESLPVPVALRKMIVPAAVSQIIVLIYNMADTFYIGRTNNPYMLAGASLILPVFNMLTCLASLAGIGGGTLLSNCVACAYFLVILWQIRLHTVLTADPRRGLPQRKNIAAVFGVGIPSAVASLLFDLDYVVIDKLMVSYSEVALAAIGIVLKVERLPLNVGIGICQGMVPLVAYNCASGNEKRMNRVIRLSLGTGLVVAAASILLYELFTPWIVRVFISDSATVSLAATFLRIRILATPPMFLSFFTVYIFQGFGNGRISLFLGVVRWLVFNIPMLYLLNFLIGMYGIVWSQITADVLTVLLSVYVYRTRRPAFAV